MKYLAIIGLITTIMKPNYYNPVNNTGNGSFNNFVQTTMQYETLGDGVTVTAGGGLFIGLESSVPLQYAVTIKINLRQVVESANIKLYFTTPFVNTYTSFNYICEGCFVNSQGNTTTSSYMDITCYSTSYAEISIIFTAEMLNDMYGYTIINLSNYDPSEVVPWITSGASWFKITSGSLISVSLGNNPYDSSLNSIMSNTDSIESLLQSIINNTSYLSTISTNITTIKNSITSLNTDFIEFSLKEQVFEAVELSASHKLISPSFVFNNHYALYSISSYSTSNLVIYDVNNNVNTNFNRNKMKIVLELNTQSTYPETMYYYVDLPLPDDRRTGPGGNVLNSYNTYLYVYSLQNSRIYRFAINFQFDREICQININQNSSTLTTPTSFTTNGNILKRIYITDSDLTNEEIDYSILEELKTLNSSLNVDTNDKDTVDSFYETLRQQMVFPSVPNTAPDMNLISYLFDFLNTSLSTPIGGYYPSSFRQYEKWLGIIVIVLVLRRVIT